MIGLWQCPGQEHTMSAQHSKSDFMARFGGVYEHSAWIADKCFDDDPTLADGRAIDLAGPMSMIVESAPREMQLALLRAHPDLAGKLAKSGTLTAESTSEQSSAGLDQCTPDEYSEFTRLNATYRDKFGFPFILAVKGRHRLEILDNFRKRCDNDVASEFREALNQVHQIARLRLQAIDDDA